MSYLPVSADAPKTEPPTSNRTDLFIAKYHNVTTIFGKTSGSCYTLRVVRPKSAIKPWSLTQSRRSDLPAPGTRAKRNPTCITETKCLPIPVITACRSYDRVVGRGNVQNRQIPVALFNVLLPFFVRQRLQETCNITHLLISEFVVQLQRSHLAYSFIQRPDFSVMKIRRC